MSLADVGARVIVEGDLAAQVDTLAVWDVSAWDSGLWGPDEHWVDLTAQVRDVMTSRGFSGESLAWQAGTAQVGFNDPDRDLSPSNATGRFTVAGRTMVRPWRRFRISLDYAGVRYPVIVVYADKYTETWPGGGHCVVAVEGADEWWRLAAAPGYERPAAGAGELFGQRIHRILDGAGHAGPRAVDDGTVTMQATTLATDPPSELDVTARSEGGSVFVDRSGAVVAQRRYALVEDAAATVVQARFGGPGGLPVADLTPEYGAAQVRNQMVYARVGGAQQIAADPASQAVGVVARRLQTDLVADSDGQVADLALWDLARWKDPEQRIARVQLLPLSDPARLIPAVCGLDMHHLVQVTHQPPAGEPITRLCHVAGIHHTFSRANPEWAVELDLVSATPYVELAASRWDVGLWDQAQWTF